MRAILFLILVTLATSLSAECYYQYVTGINEKGYGRYGSDFLAVRDGPSTRYRMLDKLYKYDKVLVCGRRGAWKHIYYGYNCSIDKWGYAYGNCLKGWSYGKYLR